MLAYFFIAHKISQAIFIVSADIILARAVLISLCKFNLSADLFWLSEIELQVSLCKKFTYRQKIAAISPHNFRIYF